MVFCQRVRCGPLDRAEQTFPLVADKPAHFITVAAHKPTAEARRSPETELPMDGTLCMCLAALFVITLVLLDPEMHHTLSMGRTDGLCLFFLMLVLLQGATALVTTAHAQYDPPCVRHDTASTTA